MALVIITAHDTDHGLEVSAVWDKPLNPAYLKSEVLMKKHLTPAQHAALQMLHVFETQVEKPKLVLPEKKLITDVGVSDPDSVLQ